MYATQGSEMDSRLQLIMGVPPTVSLTASYLALSLCIVPRFSGLVG